MIHIKSFNLINEKSNLSKFNIPINIIKFIHNRTTLSDNAEFVPLLKKDLFKNENYNAYLCVLDTLWTQEYNEDEEDDEFEEAAYFIYYGFGSWRFISIDETGEIKNQQRTTKSGIKKLLSYNKFKIYGTEATTRSVKKQQEISPNNFLKIFISKYHNILKNFYSKIEYQKRKNIKNKIMDLSDDDLRKELDDISFLLYMKKDPFSLKNKLIKNDYNNIICQFLRKNDANYHFANCEEELSKKIKEIGIDKTLRDFLEFLKSKNQKNKINI